MNIKTITCHHVYNYGASLQALALMHILTEKGHNVEIINYIPSYVRNFNSLWMIGERYKKNLFIRIAFYGYVIPIRLLQFKKKKLFDKFAEKYFRLTKEYHSFEELQREPPIADVIFCGSDQIWNTNVDNGKDPSYYAAFASKNTIRASYAASFSISEIPEGHKDFVCKMLSGMDNISVREATGLSILKNLGFNNGKQVVDPVFLPEKDYWESLVEPVRINKYVFVYDQENNANIRRIAERIAKQKKLQIIALRDLYPRLYANKAIWNAGPIEFISLIKNADFVITNSFHCTAFSLLFKRDFVVVPRTHEKVNSRMKDLTMSLGVQDRYLKDLDSIDNIKPIDYNLIHKKIMNMRELSYMFIDDTLKLKKNKINS